MSKKSKLTLLIDGNWLLMSRYSVLVNKTNSDTELAKEVQKLMIKSIMLVLKKFPDIDNIIFVSDGGSWRNSIDIPQFLVEEKEKENVPVEYKGQRKLPDDVDWKIIFGYYEELIELLNQNHITACRVQNIEGDDWCWYWSKKLNEDGTNVIIWSMDKDLTQLVSYDEKSCVFTVCWNDKTGLFIKEMDNLNNDNVDPLDFFFNDLYKQTNIDLFDNLMNKCLKVTQINPNAVVIDKIIRGDKGDNIFPIILKKSNKEDSQKLFRVSQRDIDFDLDINNDNNVKEYLHNIMSSKKYFNKMVNNDEINVFDHFKYNYKLVVLNENNYPQPILDEMNSYMNYNVNNNVSNILQYLNARNDQIIDILDTI